jgi:small subunit ribosomal protein S4e
LGRKGRSTGLKRKPAPKFWPIRRKQFTWVLKPSSGPHSLNKCVPLGLVLREFLGFVKIRREAKTIVSQGKIYINSKVIREDNFPVGLMDIISIPDVNKYFRVLPSRKGLVPYPINEEESTFKLFRIENKVLVKNGNIQLNLHDGGNLLIRVDNSGSSQNLYNTYDTVKLDFSNNQILETIKMKENSYAIITSGKNIGIHGKVLSIEKRKGKQSRNFLVTIEDKKGSNYQTILNFVFAIGIEKPQISLIDVKGLV